GPRSGGSEVVMVLQPSSLKRSPRPLERRDEEPIGPVAVRESLKEAAPVAGKLRLPPGQIAYAEIRVRAQKLLHLRIVFGLADGAGGIYEAPAGAHRRGRRIQDSP